MTTIQDIINILAPIPKEKWCVDERNNDQGQHCVLGQLDAKLGWARSEAIKEAGLDQTVLAAVNNHGRPDLYWDYSDYDVHRAVPKRRTDGYSIKRRVLAYLRKQAKLVASQSSTPTP